MQCLAHSLQLLITLHGFYSLILHSYTRTNTHTHTHTSLYGSNLPFWVFSFSDYCHWTSLHCRFSELHLRSSFCTVWKENSSAIKAGRLYRPLASMHLPEESRRRRRGGEGARSGRARTVTLPWQQLPQLFIWLHCEIWFSQLPSGTGYNEGSLQKKKTNAKDSNDWGLCRLVFDTPAIRSAFHPHTKPALNFLPTGTSTPSRHNV